MFIIILKGDHLFSYEYPIYKVVGPFDSRGVAELYVQNKGWRDNYAEIWEIESPEILQ